MAQPPSKGVSGTTSLTGNLTALLKQRTNPEYSPVDIQPAMITKFFVADALPAKRIAAKRRIFY